MPHEWTYLKGKVSCSGTADNRLGPGILQFLQMNRATSGRCKREASLVSNRISRGKAETQRMDAYKHHAASAALSLLRIGAGARSSLRLVSATISCTQCHILSFAAHSNKMHASPERCISRAPHVALLSVASARCA